MLCNDRHGHVHLYFFRSRYQNLHFDMASVASSEPFSESSESPSANERENLFREHSVRRSGFTTRPIERLATKKLPRSITNIECNHFLRSTTQESATGHKTMEFALWQEAGKHPPPFPRRPDAQYNSNVWRNFRKSYGFHTSSDGQKIGEMIASMYPLNVPPPSRIGDYTYAKFLRETPLIKDERRRQIAINRMSKDIEEFKKLRLKADMRDPPMDAQGLLSVNSRRCDNAMCGGMVYAATFSSAPLGCGIMFRLCVMVDCIV